MTEPTDVLVLVYNADGGLFAAVSDAVHKLVSPATYPCSLCAVSYGSVAMRSEWRAFLDSLPIGKKFHHRDDFRIAYPGLHVALPAILLARTGDTPSVLVDAATLDRQADVAALIRTVKERLASGETR